MATTVTTFLVASLNPFLCRSSGLPPNLVLAAKTIVLGLLLKGYATRIPGIFLPMIPGADLIPQPELIGYTLQVMALASGILLLCNRGVRTCSLLIGLIFVLSPLLSRGFYSNGRIFAGAILILIGLYEEHTGMKPVRWQVVILYLGSAINKLMHVDWRNGWYFEYWMRGILQNEMYASVASWLPPMTFSGFMCWITIAIEFLIAGGLAVPRFYRISIWLTLMFHICIVALTGMMYGIFVLAVTFSLLAFFDWPLQGEIKVGRMGQQSKFARRLLGVIRALDFDRNIDWQNSGPGGPGNDKTDRLIARRGKETYTGMRAYGLLILYLPAFYFLAALCMILPSLYLQ